MKEELLSAISGQPSATEKELAALPEGWEWFAVKDTVLNIQYGYTQSSSSDNVGPKFVRITDIQDNQVNWESVPYCVIGDAAKQKYLLEDGDLVFARTGATVGKSFLIKGSIPEAVYASYLIRLRFPKQISDKYVWYYFQSPYYWNQIIDKQVGIGQPNVNGTTLGQMEIAICPLREQRRIVAKIEELFSSLDKGIENLKTAQQQLKIYRRAVLKWAFEGRLTNENVVDGELREGWKRGTFNDVCLQIGDVDHKMPKESSGGIPYVSTKDFTDELKISFENAKRISERDYLYLSRKIRPERGDIIFPRYGTIGKNIFVDIDTQFLVSYSCAVIKPNGEVVDPKYLYYLSLSPQILHEIRKYTVETTQANIGIASINNFIVLLPPTMEEQRTIVSEIESRLSVCDKTEEAINNALKQAESLRQSILKKAFEGKLVPQDPTDEPASILLERIREERTEMPPTRLRKWRHK